MLVLSFVVVRIRNTIVCAYQRSPFDFSCYSDYWYSDLSINNDNLYMVTTHRAVCRRNHFIIMCVILGLRNTICMSMHVWIMFVSKARVSVRAIRIRIMRVFSSL